MTKISMIIPTLNEEAMIGQTLGAVQEHSTGLVEEVIIVDGGSSDQTMAIARQHGADVVTTKEKGRARQMNRGAGEASGELLYFLHADSLPPPGFDRQIVEAVEQGYPAGCFRLAFDNDNRLLRFYSWCTRFDIDAFRFGDQSLFIKQQLFADLDGFDEQLMVMEDNMMVRAIKRRKSFKIIPDNVVTSARKYERIGTIRLQLIFTLIYLMFFAGFKQDYLVSTYRKLISD